MNTQTKTPLYILSNIRGNWAFFRPEDPNAPGYPVPEFTGFNEYRYSDSLYNEPTLKVGFSGDWDRHLGERVNERDFAPGRDGKSALWLESKTLPSGAMTVVRVVEGKPVPVESIRIHAGCELNKFIRLVKLAGGDIWLNKEASQALYAGKDKKSVCTPVMLTEEELNQSIEKVNRLISLKFQNAETDMRETIYKNLGLQVIRR